MAAPPTFIQSLPIETDATDGDIVTFQVKVSSSAADPTTVSWWRCGEPLRPDPGHREIIEHEDGWHELILSNVTRDDEGEYECRAENDRGHNSAFGSLYYYREGCATISDETMEGMIAEGDGRQSGLLILIDDGSNTEESISGHSDRKSMTVSEQMQGIIEDLTHHSGSTQGEHTGSLSFEKEDENQFYSDIEDLCDDDLETNVFQDVLGMTSKTPGSQDTLIPEMPSPDIQTDVAISEGASDPYAPAVPMEANKWKSNPNISKGKREKEDTREAEGCVIWPPEEDDSPLVHFDLPPDESATTSVELPFFPRGSTTEEGDVPRGSWRCAADTPFDVADITEEEAEGDISTSSRDAESIRQSPTDVSTRDMNEAESAVKVVAFEEVLPYATQTSDSRANSRIEQDTSLTSVTEISGEAILPPEGCQQSKMSFTRSSFKSSSYQYSGDGVMDSKTSVRTSSVTSRMSFEDESVTVNKSSRMTRRELEDDSLSVSVKKTRFSSAYDADESSMSASTNRALLADTFKSEAIGDNRGIDVYVAIMDFKPMGSDEEAVAMKEGQRVEVIDASKPRRWLVRTIPTCAEESPKEGWVPACYLEKSTAFETLSSYVVTEAELDPKELEAMQNREAIVKELVETEEDFAKDMLYVVENYYKQMDNPRLPKEFRDRKGSVFGNFKDISDFHNNVLMKGVNYHAKEPTKLGKTFLRLERDFDMHANYCWNEARAQKLLNKGPLKEFFDDHSKMIDDDKLLVDHLKLPIQRLNDYQLLLKELIKYSSRLNEDTTDLQKALDFIHSINTRTKDLIYIQAMEGCEGDLLKIGRILGHDVFDVNEGNEVSASERYVFLFKGRVFITEKRVTSEKESYHVTNLFKLQDVELVENVSGDALKILFRSHKKNRSGFPLSLRARSAEQKSAWLKELQSANQVVEDLGDLEPNLGHPLISSSTEHLEKSSEKISEKSESTKEEETVALKRQDSTKKVPKTPESSAPQTPTDTDNTRPSLKRQASVKKPKKSDDTSEPQTPTETSEKPPKLLRQDSKKSKSSDTSAPETPTEVTEKPPKLSRQDSKKSTSSNPETPIDSSEKPPKFSRQDSKKSKSSDTSAPETPIESGESPPQFARQNSVKAKASDKPVSLERQDSKKVDSTPQTPIEAGKEPSFTRQDSKKVESTPQTPIEAGKEPSFKRQDSKKIESTPQTPTEVSKEPSFTRQDSKKVESTPQTPTEVAKEPSFTRQDSKKSESSDTSVPQTPTDSSTVPAFARQGSVKKKQKKPEAEQPSVPIPEADESHLLTRQDSASKKVGDKPNQDSGQLARQISKDKTQGEDLSGIPTIVMSEDMSASDARMESEEFGEDNATVASESFRSDGSMTPLGSGAYENPSLPSTPAYYHVLILVPVVCACYVLTQYFGSYPW